MRDEAEARAAIAERRAKDRHIFFEAGKHERVFDPALFLQVAPHFANELARGIRPRFEGIGDLARDGVAHPQLIFIDVSVVNAVDRELPERVVAHEDVALVVLVAEGFEEILVDDDGAGGNDRVHHVVLHQVHQHLLQARGNERAGEAHDDGAILVAQHIVEDVRGAAKIAGGKRHFAHRFDERDDVVLFDVDVFDNIDEEVGFFRFHKLLALYSWCAAALFCHAQSSRARAHKSSAPSPSRRRNCRTLDRAKTHRVGRRRRRRGPGCRHVAAAGASAAGLADVAADLVMTRPP